MADQPLRHQSTWLVEDGAHVLRPGEGVGQIGDADSLQPSQITSYSRWYRHLGSENWSKSIMRR